MVQFIKDVYLDSQVTIGLLSNVTASVVNLDGAGRAPRNAKKSAQRRDHYRRPNGRGERLSRTKLDRDLESYVWLPKNHRLSLLEEFYLLGRCFGLEWTAWR